MGMTIAVLVLPLQCFLCFLFRKAHSQVTFDCVKLLYCHETLSSFDPNHTDIPYLDTYCILMCSFEERWSFVWFFTCLNVFDIHKLLLIKESYWISCRGNTSERFHQVCVYVFVTKVAVDMSGPPSPTCQSVEMDVHLSQSELFSPSYLSLPDSSGPVRESPSSVRAHTHTWTHIKDYYSPPVSSSVPLVCAATGEQNVWHQYFRFLGCVWLGSSGRWSMSRGAPANMDFLWQPLQSTCRPRRRQHDPSPQYLQVLTCSRPDAPVEEEKGLDAASSNLSLLHTLTKCSAQPCCNWPKRLHYEQQLSEN